METIASGALAAVPAGGGSNFLVPNGTFFVELLAFVILLFIFARYLIPPINKAMTERQQQIRDQFEDLDKSKAAADDERDKYRAALTDAQAEAGRIRQQAQEDGAQIVAESRGTAQAEAQRIVDSASARTEQSKQQAEVQLRQHLGALSTDLASKIVGESLHDDARQHAIIERFLADLDSGAIAPEKLATTSSEDA
ncbi:F0F1 ATP synthase subunit B [Flexivirga caeni]|uniref:ATP synthase subunit b n=1 Tax=Flexivirga caeni TaxID=2294115 RepID=A0A3M9M5T1_9MICO|nr:F0F1 ATP synthase subunit B [Flexivirga caeni]RNI20900.1 F0F1 ATP synthase subunit B [Flexivirga caeni]